MLALSNFAIRAPVAVVYDGGGVYFGGTSSGTTGVIGTSKGIVVIVGDAGLASISRRSATDDLRRRSTSGRYSN